MLILIVSAGLSGIIDNIPYVATMSPVVADLTAAITDPVQAQALWWALAAGADFGGNLTAVGASATSSCWVSPAKAIRSASGSSPRKGAVVTIVTIALAAPYLWLRYFVFR